MVGKNSFAFLFDVDGVLIETPHEESWRDAAIEYGLIDENFNFTSFYQNHVAGIPGIKGAETILERTGYYISQNIKSQEEREKYAEDLRRIKQKFFDSYIENRDFIIFEDVISIAKNAKNDGIPIAAVSSSENAEKILRRTNLYDFFDSLTLGAKTYNLRKKENLYVFAFGKLCGKLELPSTIIPIVFEDAGRAIVEVKDNINYFCIGIARRGLTTTSSLLEKGADLAYDESTLREKGYSGLISDLEMGN